VAAEEASKIARVLDDPALRAAAYSGESRVTHRVGRHADALVHAERPLEFVDELRDPEQVIEVYGALVPIQTMLGRFDDARRITALQDEATQRLTAHHRVYGVSLRASAEDRADRGGEPRHAVHQEPEDAPRLVARAPRTRGRRRVGAARGGGGVARHGGLRPPAQRTAAQARAAAGDDALERHVGAGTAAVSRDLYWWSIAASAARLDALVRLGADERVEEEAEPLVVHTGTYIEPFALRALGYVRNDRALISRALEAFAALGVRWHAEQPRLPSSA
jgi:hypothetical protein